MLCSYCKKNEAEFKMQAVIKKRLKSLRLCPQCAKRKEKELGFEEGALLFYATPLFSGRTDSNIFLKAKKGLRCSNCGLYYSEFKSSGKLGCPACYENFAPQLKYVLGNLHGSTKYSGKKYPGP